MTTVKKTQAKAEDHFQDVLRRLEQVAYELVAGKDDDDLSSELCLNVLDVLDAVRLR